MSKRAAKLASLVLCGGVVLQAGGCAGILIQLVAEQIFSGVLSTILSQIISSAVGNNSGTTP